MIFNVKKINRSLFSSSLNSYIFLFFSLITKNQTMQKINVFALKRAHCNRLLSFLIKTRHPENLVIASCNEEVMQ